MHQICNRNPFSLLPKDPMCNGTFVMVARRKRRSSGAGTISSMVKWQRSGGVGGTKMQWRNGVARRRRRRCSGGHEQPPPRCSGDATVVKPGRTIGVQWKKKKKKRFAMLYGGCSEKKKSQKVCAAAKRFGFFYNPTKPYCLG
ncbi:hypothetical protein DEO72_LG1g2057 [Vigna unguiculata]|uniref:Uncharacterized protein n=1 Tax=Vigna unguiculata TaxID=3917 RepID=A0A4D6KXH1_VIGUN|nr:hypothetical protein DEO72_LG1g2057 [Vigna unguiculata]